ncbi:ankyrin repeat-containing domain protein [Schizothecium vesticola]|uniref:Ankyrin repeat-containing domain protein n=1 Tax=Schizothecium vesticola TaxID=314040 RepID=A0AA40KD92_9PEZI|nr:ankyrin repeat-containing domain protein [Schizothecium vesticola]
MPSRSATPLAYRRFSTPARLPLCASRSTYTPLLNAARNGRRDIARLLWERVGPEARFYPSEPGNPAHAGEISCLQVAAAHGYAALGADFLNVWDSWTPDETRRTLVAAAAAWHGDVVALLLDRAAFTADAIQDALAASVGPGNGDDDLMARQHGVVRRLLDAGGDPNGTRRGRPMLLVAASSATCLGALKALLEKGADPNIQDVTSGTTALHQYRRVGRAPSSPATAEVLLRHGASPDLADREGETPVHAIAFAGTLEDLKLYLNYCCDVDAALRGYVDAVELLLNYSLDVNSANNNGWMPLVCALMPTSRKRVSTAVDVANLLLRHGASAGTSTAEKWTPMHALDS